MSSTTRRMRRIAGVLVAGALLVGVSACAADSEPASSLADAGAEGVDDGSTLTLWTRAPLEKQANLLVDAYNESPREPGRAHGRAERRLRRQGRRGGRLERPARPLRGRHRLRAELGRAGALPGHHGQHRRPRRSRTRSTPGHLSAGTLDDKEHVLPFVLDLSMLFWNKDLFDRGRPRPRDRRRRTSQEFAEWRQGHPGAEQARHVRHRHGPELRRMPRLHLVPERVGRRRGGHVRRRHRVAARERHRQGDLLHVEGPVGLGRRAPVVAGRGRPHLDRGLHRGQGRPHVLPRHAALVDPVRRGRRRHPRPRGRRVDVRRR